MALFGPSAGPRRCRFIGVNRKSLAHPQNDATDPKRTWVHSTRGSQDRHAISTALSFLILDQRRCCLRQNRVCAVDDFWIAHEVDFDARVTFESVFLRRQQVVQLMVRHSDLSIDAVMRGATRITGLEVLASWSQKAPTRVGLLRPGCSERWSGTEESPPTIV